MAILTLLSGLGISQVWLIHIKYSLFVRRLGYSYPCRADLCHEYVPLTHCSHTWFTDYSGSIALRYNVSFSQLLTSCCFTYKLFHQQIRWLQVSESLLGERKFDWCIHSWTAVSKVKKKLSVSVFSQHGQNVYNSMTTGLSPSAEEDHVKLLKTTRSIYPVKYYTPVYETKSVNQFNLL